MFAEHNIQRVQLSADQPYRLPGGNQMVYVVAGTAWVTTDGKDRILQAHERLCVKSNAHPVVISRTGRAPLVFDIFATRQKTSALKVLQSRTHQTVKQISQRLAKITE
jgi:hypothetical protein